MGPDAASLGPRAREFWGDAPRDLGLVFPPPERPQETYPAPQPCTMHRPNRSLGPHRFVEPCWARLDDIPRCSAVAIRGRSASCWVCSTGAPLQWEALASGGFGCAPHVLRQGG